MAQSDLPTAAAALVIMVHMPEVTRILEAIGDGDPQASAELLPLVYNELRKLAAQRLAQEAPGQTLQATALVHEAYLRLLGPAGDDLRWNGRGHFFAAAAEAMRRILIENARRKSSEKHGGDMKRVALAEIQATGAETSEKFLAIDEALTELEKLDQQAGQLFKLRYFAGCSIEEAGDILGIPRATAYRQWTFARAWILKHLSPSS
jgi:RNA polymerase sigma factor (TIGR02999 family)